MVDPTEDLVLEILRQIEADLAEISADIKYVKALSTDIRAQLATMQRRSRDQSGDPA